MIAYFRNCKCIKRGNKYMKILALLMAALRNTYNL